MAGPRRDDVWQAHVRNIMQRLGRDLESRWNCCIDVGEGILEECMSCTVRDLAGGVGLSHPEALRRAGTLAYWIRLLKPLHVVNVERVVGHVGDLVKRGMLEGEAKAVREFPDSERHVFVNEYLALALAGALLETKGWTVDLRGRAMYELAARMRYEPYSVAATMDILAAHGTPPAG